jgi:hypothetical protein
MEDTQLDNMLVYRDGNRIGVNVNLSRKEMGYNTDDVIVLIRLNGKDLYFNHSMWVYEKEWMKGKRDSPKYVTIVDPCYEGEQIIEEPTSWYYKQVKAAEEQLKKDEEFMDRCYMKYLEELKRRANDRETKA